MPYTPPEIWTLIAANLSVADKISLANTSTTMRTLVYESLHVWEVVDLVSIGSTDTILTILTEKLNHMVKANIRVLILDGISLSSDNLATIFGSCSSLETLSLRMPASDTFKSLKKYICLPDPTQPSIPRTLRRILLGGPTNSDPAIKWAEACKIRDGLARKMRVPIHDIDIELSQCKNCSDCVNLPPMLCSSCGSHPSSNCQTCLEGYYCALCGSFICKDCRLIGHPLAICYKHRICDSCSISLKCTCGALCCPLPQCHSRKSKPCSHCNICQRCEQKKVKCPHYET